MKEYPIPNPEEDSTAVPGYPDMRMPMDFTVCRSPEK